MNVLLIHAYGDPRLPSGESVVFEREADGLRRGGVTVNTLTVERPLRGNWIERIQSMNVVWSRRHYQRIRKAIVEFRPDIVHAHGILPSLTVSALAACFDANVPVVQTLHNYRWFCVEGGMFRKAAYCDQCLSSGPFRGVMHRCCRHSTVASSLMTVNNRLFVNDAKLHRWVTRYIAVSDFVKKVHVRAGFPQNQLVVKYNGVPVSETMPRRDSPVDVLFVGRLDIAKGTPILNELSQRLPGSMKLHVVGAGNDEAQLNLQSAANERLVCHGRQSAESIRRLMVDAACVVIPSFVPESFGLVAAEAMSAGVPIVASKTGALTELIQNSGSGVTVAPPWTPQAFADGIAQVTASDEQSRQFGQQGFDFARKHLSIEVTMARLLEIYRDAIEQHRSHEKPQSDNG